MKEYDTKDMMNSDEHQLQVCEALEGQQSGWCPGWRLPGQSVQVFKGPGITKVLCAAFCSLGQEALQQPALLVLPAPMTNGPMFAPGDAR